MATPVYYKEDVKKTILEYRGYCFTGDSSKKRYYLVEGVYISDDWHTGLLDKNGIVHENLTLIIAKRILGSKEWIPNPDFVLN